MNLLVTFPHSNYFSLFLLKCKKLVWSIIQFCSKINNKTVHVPSSYWVLHQNICSSTPSFSKSTKIIGSYASLRLITYPSLITNNIFDFLNLGSHFEYNDAHFTSNFMYFRSSLQIFLRIWIILKDCRLTVFLFRIRNLF